MQKWQIDEDDRQELIQQSLNELRYRRRLTQHPDCRDPDHPGCKKCEPEYFD